MASDFGFIGGGNVNVINSHSSFIGGGNNNQVTDNVSPFNNIVGGQRNNIGSEAIYNSIVGGQDNNVVNSSFTGILGGANNIIDTVSNFGVIAGGSQNRIQGQVSQVFSAIGGGQLNTVSGNHAVISGGHSNTVSGSCSGILGGSGNNVTHDWSFAAGCNLTSITDCAFHANILVSQNMPAYPGGGSGTLMYFPAPAGFPLGSCVVLIY